MSIFCQPTCMYTSEENEEKEKKVKVIQPNTSEYVTEVKIIISKNLLFVFPFSDQHQ